MADTSRLPVIQGAFVAPGGAVTLNFGAVMGSGYIRVRPATPYDTTALTVLYFVYGLVPPPAVVGGGGFGIQPNESVNIDDTDFTDLSFQADGGAMGVVVEVIAYPRPGNSSAGVL